MGRILALGILGTLACAQIAAAQAGSVTGTITTSAKGAAPVRVTIDQNVCGNELPDEAIVVDAQGRLASAVVMLTGLKRPTTADAVVMNEKCRFGPRVQLAGPNANVRTTSKDPILHTTQAQTGTGRSLFNVALPMPGINITRPIGGPGTVRLNCNTHPWMRGWVIVTEYAAAVSGTDGKFSIDNVPPGTYELRVWHEALKGAAQKITVAAGRASIANFQLK